MTALLFLFALYVPLPVFALGVQVCMEGDRVAHSGGKITCFKGSSISSFRTVQVGEKDCISEPILVPRNLGDDDSARIFIQAASAAGAFASNTEFAIQLSSIAPTGCARIPPRTFARGSFDATRIAFVTSPASTSARSMGYCDTSRSGVPSTTSVGGSTSPSFAVAGFDPVTSCTSSGAGFSNPFSLNFTHLALSFRCPTFYTRTMTPTGSSSSQSRLHTMDPKFRSQLPDVYLSVGVLDPSQSAVDSAASGRSGSFLHVRIRCTTEDAVADGSAATAVTPVAVPSDPTTAAGAQFPTVGQCRWVEWCSGAPGQPTNGDCLAPSSASLEAMTRYCTGVGGITSGDGVGCRVVAVGEGGSSCNKCGLKLPGQYLNRILLCAPTSEQATATLFEVWKGRFASIPRFATATHADGGGSVGATPITLCEGGVSLGGSSVPISPQASRVNTSYTPIPSTTPSVGSSRQGAAGVRSAAAALCEDEGDRLQRVTAAISFSVTPARLATLRATVEAEPFKEAKVEIVGEGVRQAAEAVGAERTARQQMVNVTAGAECGAGNQTCCALFQTYARCILAVEGELGCSCGSDEVECAASSSCDEERVDTSSSSKSLFHLLWLLCLIPGCSALLAVGMCLLAARRRKRSALNEGLADFSPQFEPVAYDDYEIEPAPAGVAHESYGEVLHEDSVVW